LILNHRISPRWPRRCCSSYPTAVAQNGSHSAGTFLINMRTGVIGRVLGLTGNLRRTIPASAGVLAPFFVLHV
jgi:hypothetical protein